jgi:hypothetical protein
MLISKASFGCIVWLKTYEQGDEEVLEELNKLKTSKPVFVFCSGSEETVQLLKKAAMIRR